MSVLSKLTEGIVQRDLRKEGAALLEKWERTGLLQGLSSDRQRNTMAQLLENQAKELLREASTMAGGDVEGFASVAFPIVRRVFGGLTANEVVSVQPMSLPAGLIFFLDFKFTSDRPMHNTGGTSIYGGGVLGQQLTGGVDLGTQDPANPERGFYNLNTGYASPTGSATLAALTIVASGVVGDQSGDDVERSVTAATIGGSTVSTSLSKLCRFDPDLSGSSVIVITAPGDSELTRLNRDNLTQLTPGGTAGAGDETASTDYNSTIFRQARRLTTLVGRSAAKANSHISTLDPTDGNDTSILMVFTSTGSAGSSAITTNLVNHFQNKTLAITYPLIDHMSQSTTLGAVVGADDWGLENEENIPEIDIKVDSVAVTAITKKLKAKWTPELGQDLNAYHNLDAEVELTSILSEQIALEIDKEILNDLIQGASAATLYWSRSPGLFVNRETGAEVGAFSKAPDFTGTVSEWYETLLETVNDVSAQIHRKTLRGGANFLITSPEVANILEFTAGFRASVAADGDKGLAGLQKTGQISKKFDVYVDPYFPRNVVLVGRKGSSFLESGYVYAPYVPLQVTPTIFGVEDFIPRKGVMTRYAKKMVRPDMYGLVIVRGLLNEEGQ